MGAKFAGKSSRPLSHGRLTRPPDAMKRSGGLSWSQMVMAANAPMLFKASMVEGSVESGVMAGGQVSGLIDELPSCKELIDGIVAQASRILEGFESPSG